MAADPTPLCMYPCRPGGDHGHVFASGGGSLEGAVPAACLEEAFPVHTQSFLPPVCGSGFSARANQMWINDAE